ncbi:hypothetical protein IFM89_015693 [Coptis chinensis]|uniref:Uncharacterized protein n=1 Tax=Coptis chinensis TaxID=261450 RepID=A0A835M0A7_9MAGN|nr:hypothetical protein IFM89_015693 [Coptis chinensis]
MGEERTFHAWSKVLASVNWQLSQESIPCREILALRYTDLPPHLKSCFLYLGIYPEDYVINVEKLILLWVAEGFVHSRGEQNTEDVAEDSLEELIQRRDLAISEAEKNKGRFSIYYRRRGRFCISYKITTTAIQNSSYDCRLNSSHPNLRSPLIFSNIDSVEHAYIWDWKFIEGIRMIRVLDLENIKLPCSSLPKEIGKLILLHYLGLRKTGLERLPSDVCYMVKLQTLDLRGNYVKNLPEGILKMKDLRHLYLAHRIRLKFTCQAINGFGQDLTLEIHGSAWMYKGGGLSNVLSTHGWLRSLKRRGPVTVGNYSLKTCFPSSVTKLELQLAARYEDDPLGVLGLGKLIRLHNIEKLTFEDGAMPRLKHLRIKLCYGLKKLPDGLGNITNLQKVQIVALPEFMDRIKENGEDWELGQDQTRVPNTLNVITNFPFLIVGVFCLVLCLQGSFFAISSRGEVWGWVFFYAGIVGTAFGSAYYHLKPEDNRVIWDRFPMMVAYAALLSNLVLERVGIRIGITCLFSLLSLAVVSIAYERNFDDLRLCMMFHLIPSVVIPTLAIRYPPKYTHSRYWLWATGNKKKKIPSLVALKRKREDTILVHFEKPGRPFGAGVYLLSRFEDIADRKIYRMNHYIISGHSLEHLCLVMVPVFLTVMLMFRSFRFPRDYGDSSRYVSLYSYGGFSVGS